MLNRHYFSFCLFMLLSACSELPQQGQLEYTALATNAEYIRLSEGEWGLSAREVERLEQIRMERLFAELKMETWALSKDSTPRFIGYGGPHGSVGFVLHSSGAGEALASPSSTMPLLAGTDAIFEVRTLRDSSGRLVARSPRGITIWRLAPPFDALVIGVEPQTFNKTRILDAVEVVGQNQLAVATDNGHVTFWSTRSGQMTSEIVPDDYQPRVLAQNIDETSLIFGTNTGEVVWTSPQTRNPSRLLYRHSGPVLDLFYDAPRRLIISSSKDGSVILWSTEKDEELARWKFSSPVYRVERLADTARFLLKPVSGHALVIDLEAPEDSWRIHRFGAVPIAPVQADAESDLMLIRFADEEVKVYDISNIQRLTTIRARQSRGISGAELLHHSRRVLFVDTAGDLWIQPIQEQNPIHVMRTDGIVGVAVNREQNQLMVSLIDGRLITLELRASYTDPLDLRSGGIQ